MNSYKGRKAKRKAKEFARSCNDEELEMYIHYWSMEKKIRCFILGACVILLVRCKRDPMMLQKKPYIIRYIYTKAASRRTGDAYRLVRDLKICNIETTVYCMNNASINLFDKSKFRYNGNKCFMGYPIYRFPE
jgi:hypothetical protein